MERIAENPTSLEVRVLLFSHLVIRSLLPKQYQLNGRFSDFINKLSDDLDHKEFKGKLMQKTCFKPVYKHEAVEDYNCSSAPAMNMNAYTGLFGVIVAVAVLYTIKNR